MYLTRLERKDFQRRFDRWVVAKGVKRIMKERAKMRAHFDAKMVCLRRRIDGALRAVDDYKASLESLSRDLDQLEQDYHLFDNGLLADLTLLELKGRTQK
jgi:hypothetical protein